MAAAWLGAALPCLAVETPRLSGLLDLGYALGTERGHAQKLEAVFQPRIDWELGDGWSLMARGRLRADAYDRIWPGEPPLRSVSILSKYAYVVKQVDAELRELTLAGSLGPVRLTLGKQQIVWGEADGLKVLDRVDPEDFREFILPPFEDSRIPLWAVKAELPIGPATLQLLLQPDPSFHLIPEPDAEFAFTAPRFLPPLLPGRYPIVQPVDRPDDLVRNGDAGARLSGTLGRFDLSLAWLYHYDDVPIWFGDRISTALGPAVEYSPGYRRSHLLGGTFSTTLGDFTLRGELAVETQKYLSTTDANDPDLVKPMPEAGYVLGVDWFGLRDTLLSAQFFQSWLGESAHQLLRDQHESVVTLLARHSFLNERLVTEAIWMHSIEDGDGLVRPRVSYELRTGLNAWVGFDVFYGTSRGAFGEFGSKDRFAVGLRWGFP